MTASTGSAPRPRGRTARGQGGQLRPEILTAAADLLDETGDEQAVTLRAVARRVGVTAPALYAHFHDREEILLAVVQGAFAELTRALSTAGPPPGSPDAPEGGARSATAHLRAVCTAYLDFAVRHPQRYRVMFGGLWSAQRAVDEGALTADQATGLGQEALRLIVSALEACVRTGASTSTDTTTDAVALWLGLHGLAHQRAVVPAFPWPAGIADHVVSPLAHLADPAS